jgi:hypothetical protein
MTDLLATPEYLAVAAQSCHRSAMEIQLKLALLRGYVRGLESERLGLSASQFQALLTGYDIYARMLDDALADIASVLDGGVVTGPSSMTRPASSLEE